MKLFIAPNSAVTFDSAMGYKNNPQLVQNQAADFSFAPDLHLPFNLFRPHGACRLQNSTAFTREARSRRNMMTRHLRTVVLAALKAMASKPLCLAI